MKLFYPKPFIVGLLLCPIGSLFADWPNWRGPNFNGSVDKEESYPTFFDQKNSVKWTLALDGPSASTPIIFGNRIFLSGTRLNPKNELNSALLALCADKETGEVLWEKSAGSGYQPGNNDVLNYNSIHDQIIPALLRLFQKIRQFSFMVTVTWFVLIIPEN